MKAAGRFHSVQGGKAGQERALDPAVHFFFPRVRDLPVGLAFSIAARTSLPRTGGVGRGVRQRAGGENQTFEGGDEKEQLSTNMN